MTEQKNAPAEAGTAGSIGKEALLAYTAEIVAAHVSHNNVDASTLPAVIKDVYSALEKLSAEVAAPQEELKPAVSPRKSIQPDYLICLEDGKKLKMLKRHLRTQYGLSPEEYRARWGLPADYPMVAPNYARHRQQLAKQIGLGKRGKR